MSTILADYMSVALQLYVEISGLINSTIGYDKLTIDTINHLILNHTYELANETATTVETVNTTTTTTTTSSTNKYTESSYQEYISNLFVSEPGGLNPVHYNVNRFLPISL